MGKRYMLVRIYNASDSATVEASHPELVDLIYDFIKSKIPAARRNTRPGAYRSRFDNLQNNSNLLVFWIRQFLCDTGWEPVDWKLFRKEEETE